MSIAEYEHYLEETNGIVPEKGMTAKDSFNNVVYHAHLLIAREVNGKLNKADIDLFRSHLEQNRDDKGLYKPKNSKDNLIAMAAACYKYGLTHELKAMDLKYMVTSSYLNPWDAFFYIYCKGSKLTKLLITPFLVCITYLQMWAAVAKGRKVRPHLWERILWTLQGKKYELRYYVNDGKQLTILKSSALKKDFPRLTKFIRGRFLKRYQDKTEYPYIIFYAFFRDKAHPVIKEYQLAKMFNREVL